MCHLLQRSLFIYTFSFHYALLRILANEKKNTTKIGEWNIFCTSNCCVFSASFEFLFNVFFAAFVFLHPTENRNEYVFTACHAVEYGWNAFGRLTMSLLFRMPELGAFFSFVCLFERAFINLRSCHQSIYGDPNARFSFDATKLNDKKNEAKKKTILSTQIVNEYWLFANDCPE